MKTAIDKSYQYCRYISRKEAKNFYYSFLVLPKEKRDSMCAIYTFMRYCDDAVDKAGDIPGKKRALDECRNQLESALRGIFHSHPMFPAFHETVQRYHIPHPYFFELMDGLEMDLTNTRYTNFEELYKYCYKVASVVGLVTIHVFGFEEEEKAKKYAEYCGIAFQLTNILRDIREDYAMGRVYIPQEDFQKYNCSENILSDGKSEPVLRKLVEYEVNRAQEYYTWSLPLIPLIHPSSRACLIAMMKIYGGLLFEIRKKRYDVFSNRIRLPVWKKMIIGLQAWKDGRKPL